MIKLLIDKLRLRLSTVVQNYSDLRSKDEKKLRKWLADTYRNEEAMKYLTRLDFGLMKEMSGGMTDSNLYWSNVGRRMMILHFLSSARKEFDLEEKERRKTESQ
jgi:hypothetical protein